MKKKAVLTREARDKLTEYANSRIHKLWAYTEGSIWVRHEDLPDVDSELLVESELIEDEKRVAALEKGAKPTATEIKRYQNWWAESQLEDPSDYDRTPGYALAPINDGEGNQGIALILQTGYSFSYINTWLEGVFSSEDEAIAWMKKGGWC